MTSHSTLACALVTLALAASVGCLGDPSGATTSATVTMKDSRFAPADLTVRVGTLVSFVNADDVAHEPTFAGSALHTPPGATSQRTFDVPGDVQYFCRVHAGMRGAVHVTRG